MADQFPVHPDPQAAWMAESLRGEIAARRDFLIGRQRRHYSHDRQALIDRLGDDYRNVQDIAIRAGRDTRIMAVRPYER